MLYEIRSQLVVLDEKAHVNRTVERIEKEVKVGVFAEFAAGDRAPESTIGLVSARQEEAFPECPNQISVALPRSQDGRHDSTPAAAENFDQLAHLLTHVGVHRSGVGEVQLARNAAGECVGDESPLVRPPAVHGGFTNRRLLGNFLNFEFGKSVLPQDL